MAGSTGIKQALQKAREIAKARAEFESQEQAEPAESDLTEAECFVRLVIEMYASKLRVGMGILPDGMAIFIRLTYPTTCSDPHAGMVSFVVSNDTLGVLRKAVQALESAPKPPYWKPDQYARASTST